MRWFDFVPFLGVCFLPFSAVWSAGLPDLKISSIVPSPAPVDGKNILTVRIQNSETVNSGACRLTLFLRSTSGAVSKEKTLVVPVIKGGQTADISCAFGSADTWETGEYIVIAALDTDQKVTEVNEHNNDFVLVFRWRENGAGTLPEPGIHNAAGASTVPLTMPDSTGHGGVMPPAAPPSSSAGASPWIERELPGSRRVENERVTQKWENSDRSRITRDKKHDKLDAARGKKDMTSGYELRGKQLIQPAPALSNPHKPPKSVLPALSNSPKQKSVKPGRAGRKAEQSIKGEAKKDAKGSKD